MFDLRAVTGAGEYAYSIELTVQACDALVTIDLDETGRLAELELCEAGPWWNTASLASAKTAQCELSGAPQTITAHPVHSVDDELWVLTSDRATEMLNGSEVTELFKKAHRYPIWVVPNDHRLDSFSLGGAQRQITGAFWSFDGTTLDAFSFGNDLDTDAPSPSVAGQTTTGVTRQHHGELVLSFNDKKVTKIVDLLTSNHGQNGERTVVGCAVLHDDEVVGVTLTVPVQVSDKNSVVGLGLTLHEFPTSTVEDGNWINVSELPCAELTNRTQPMTPLTLETDPDEIYGYLLGPNNNYVGLHWFTTE